MPTQVATIRDSLYSGFTTFMNFIPTLLGAIAVLVVGWILSNIVDRIVDRVLTSFKLNHISSKSGLDRFMVGPRGRFEASYGIGMLAKWFIRLIFLQAAANLLQMPQVTAIINSILMFIPNVAVALIILVVGDYFSRYLASLVGEATSKTGLSRPFLFPLITRYAVMGFAIIAALNHLGIGVVVVNTLFFGLVASLSLALGLAFGLGGQGVASEVTRSWYEQSKSDRFKSIRGGQAKPSPEPLGGGRKSG